MLAAGLEKVSRYAGEKLSEVLTEMGQWVPIPGTQGGLSVPYGWVLQSYLENPLVVYDSPLSHVRKGTGAVPWALTPHAEFPVTSPYSGYFPVPVTLTPAENVMRFWDTRFRTLNSKWFYPRAYYYRNPAVTAQATSTTEFLWAGRAVISPVALKPGWATGYNLLPDLAPLLNPVPRPDVGVVVEVTEPSAPPATGPGTVPVGQAPRVVVRNGTKGGRPVRGVRERKVRLGGPMTALIKRFIGAGTEMLDLLDALARACGWRFDPSKMSVPDKIDFLFGDRGGIANFDWDVFVGELVKNQVEDMWIGMVSRGAAQGAIDLGLPRGVQTGPLM